MHTHNKKRSKCKQTKISTPDYITFVYPHPSKPEKGKEKCFMFVKLEAEDGTVLQYITSYARCTSWNFLSAPASSLFVSGWSFLASYTKYSK